MTGFFSQINQKEIPIGKHKGKSPMFFRKFNMMAAIFTADYSYCKNLIPNNNLKVLRILPDRALVALHCMEYLDTDVGPYNEVSLSIGVSPDKTALSLPSVLKSVLNGHYHAFIVQLPVTTEIAWLGGIEYFNYPKFIANIEFTENKNRRICSLTERNSNNLILEFSGKKLVEKKSLKNNLMQLHSYPIMNGKLVHARMKVNRLAYSESFLSNDTILSIGQNDFSKQLKEFKLGQQIYYLYAPHCESIMYLPETFVNETSMIE